MVTVPTPESRIRATGRQAGRAIGRTARSAWQALAAGPWTVWRIAAWIAGTLAAFLAAAVLWLYFLDWNTMRGPVARYASHRLGRTVRIDGKLAVDLFRWEPRVSASDVRVANPDWAQPGDAGRFPHLAFSVRLIPLLFGRTILPYVRFDNPDIVVLRRTDGATNWTLEDGNTGWKLPPIRQFLIDRGHIRIDDRIRKLRFDGAVSSRETAGGRNAAFELTGDGTLNGRKFSASIQGGPLLNVDATRPYAFRADVREGDTRVLADGAITHPFNLGQFSAQTTLSGANLSDLYDLTGLAMPRTGPYRVGGTLTRDGALYRFAKFEGTVGASDLEGTLTVDASGEKPYVTGTVSSRVLDFKDLGQIFGGKSQAAVAEGRLLPDIPLHIDRLRQMDADVGYDAGTIRSRDFPLRGVHTHINLKNSVLTLKPLAFQFAYGRLSGGLSIDASRATPRTSVDARVTDIKIEQFMEGSGAPAATGLLEARAQLKGSGSSVRDVAASADGPVTLVVPHGNFNEKLAELTGINLLNALFIGGRQTTEMRCAVAHFDAKNGVMTSSGYILDTDPVRIEGRGSIDLKNETVKMTISGKPKAFRIGRLHAPITVSGPLAHPEVGIQSGPLVAQAGIAAALGFLFPPAAILPFVDPGLAEDANCAGLLTVAKAQGAPVKKAQVHR